ncbi:hypothetical protein [Desulforhopalus sp. IMCC35007]|uniref:hypothetical protein n=1 Tax=Desulforhopalus sp. IMCC35007 TaxID=2569543 RepID=UPI0010AE3441|nr:hypothetical protein [Desulforhopalus sp. IMCC35007]TKB08419.1 hypothetical protein FCL48_13895 [Desulforhopalus sp. IMCC35007]
MTAMIKNREEQIKCAFDELIGKGNLGIIEATFADDYIVHAGDKEFGGQSFVKNLRCSFVQLFPI